MYESLKRQTPLGRVAEPHELAGTVVFLASRHASYISGATINVSGGFLMY
jgi:NAD(P)-dependent dehydrogenase (short-subunit alcohol dehydrogenase family)